MEQILIVEDDITLNSGLCQALKDSDRQLVSCECISEAKEQLTLGMVTLAILDINLPDGNGLDLLKEIKRNTPAEYIERYGKFWQETKTSSNALSSRNRHSWAMNFQ